MKQAVIDIGSNSMRLSVYETTEAGTFTILFKDKIMAGLAGYVEEGALSPEGITRAILGLRSFRGTLRALNIPQVAVFATASLRNIRNTAQAVAEIQRGTGFAIEVLSGEEEARLGYAGAMEELRRQEFKSVHILVAKENKKALASYKVFEYKTVGACFLHEHDYWCYEKAL